MVRVPYVVDPATSGPAPCGAELVFFQAQVEPILGQIIDEGRVLPCTGENGRFLTV